jgi:hypothetical protein
MTDDMIALAKRAVACKGWRWMAGMQFIHRHDIGPDVWYPRIGRQGEKAVRHKIRKDVLPIFNDPATLGCLLALVREAHRTAGLVPIDMDHGEWQVIFRGGHVVGASEAAVLVAALEGAP